MYDYDCNGDADDDLKDDYYVAADGGCGVEGGGGVVEGGVVAVVVVGYVCGGLFAYVLVNYESSNVVLPIVLKYDLVDSVGGDSLIRLRWVDVVVVAADDEIVHYDHWQVLRPKYEHQQHDYVLLLLLANYVAPENVTKDLDDISVAFLEWYGHVLLLLIL